MRTVVAVASLCLAGCYLSHELGGPVDAAVPHDAPPREPRDAMVDAHDATMDAPDVPPTPCVPVPVSVRPVDVLFVVDDSRSMQEEQAQLATQIPRFVGGLATGDADADGVQDFPPVDDLHVGVITVNMGVGGLRAVPSCEESPDFGDDGVLLNAPRTMDAACEDRYPRFLSFMDGDRVEVLSRGLLCLARTGTGGCGVEQQLDAMLKALLPSTSPVTFFRGTHGHGDDPDTNGGFLRDGSVIAVVMLTDEDDCSTDATDLWNPLSLEHPLGPDNNCITYSDELYPIDRFVDGLRSLRPGAPDDIVFLAITGVPPDATAGTTIDYDALFAHPRMQIVFTGSTPPVIPACSAPGTGIAEPALRIAHVAQALGGSALVQSICNGDYHVALSWLAGRAGARAACE